MTNSNYVHFYVRVSHRQSAESGLSEPAQLAALQDYYKQVRVQLTRGRQSYPYNMPPGVFSDRGVSAWRNPLSKRPAGSRLLEAIKPGDHIIFYDVSRAFRSTGDYGKTVDNWLKAGITPHFVANGLNLSTAAGRLMGNFHATWAQYYSDIISERTREALAIKRMTGKAKESDPAIKWEWKASDVIIKPPAKAPKQVSGRVFMYSRCSSYDQVLSGLGKEVQREGNKRYAASLAASEPGLTLSNEVFEDDSVSSFSVPFRKRPAGKRLFEMLRPGDKVVMYRLDRGFRNELDALSTVNELLERQVEIHLASEGINSGSEMGVTWFTLMVAFASLESRIKSQRSKDVNDELRRQGRPLGEIPRGTKAVEENGKKYLQFDKKALSEIFMVGFLTELGLTEQQLGKYLTAITAQEKKLKPGGKRWCNHLDECVSKYCTKTKRAYAHEIAKKYPDKVVRECSVMAVKRLAKPIQYPYRPKIIDMDLHKDFCHKSPKETAEIFLQPSA